MAADDTPRQLPRIRVREEDFRVEELAPAPPEGEGEHLYLWVEKRGRDTEAVARELARRAGVSPAEVGFAGRKDRRAVTRQWFSVPRVAPEVARSWQIDGIEVLDVAAGRRRLRLGDLAGNRFEIRVRNVSEGVAAFADRRLAELVRHGCPNFFGDQRFGSDGDNPRLGAALLRGERVPGSRRQQRFLVSALQAEVFNRVLRRRPWPCDELVPGDLAVVHRSGRLEEVSRAEAASDRLADFAVSPTGPLVGPKMRAAGGAVAQLERQVLDELEVEAPELWRLPRGLRVFGERRPLRMPLRLAASEAEGRELLLRFELPGGAYATVVLGELLPEGFEEG